MTTYSPPAPVEPPPVRHNRRRLIVTILAVIVALVLGAAIGAASKSDNAGKVSDLQAKNAAQTKTIGDQNAQISGLQSTLNDRNAEISDLQGKVTSAQAEADKRAAANIKPREDRVAAREAAVKKREDAVAKREQAVGQAEAAAKANTFGDGTWRVGNDIKPGTYRTAGAVAGDILPNCYWARLSNTSGDFDAIIANGNTVGPTVVTIAPTDLAFESNGCQDWHKVN